MNVRTDKRTFGKEVRRVLETIAKVLYYSFLILGGVTVRTLAILIVLIHIACRLASSYLADARQYAARMLNR